jgi:hypothetical protein
MTPAQAQETDLTVSGIETARSLRVAGAMKKPAAFQVAWNVMAAAPHLELQGAVAACQPKLRLSVSVAGPGSVMGCWPGPGRRGPESSQPILPVAS